MTTVFQKKNDILKQTTKIRWNYYLKIKKQVEGIIGNTTKELKKYTLQYEDEIKRSLYKQISSSYFFKSVQNSNVLLIGDFHAQVQSARSFLRVCRKLSSQRGDDKIVIVLECFNSKDQNYIDSYMKGEISEQDFLKHIEWHKNWGFPWENTRVLLRWAITHGISVYGMNLEINKTKLKSRDQHFAEIINSVYNKNKKKIIMVQVGDFHLAKKHLPFELKKINKNLEIQTVFQSPDLLYFKTLKASDFLQLSDCRWALMTVVPWVKWQDYLLFLESGFDKSITVDEIDVTDHVDRFVNLICHSIGLKIENQNLSIYTAQDPQVSRLIKKLDIGLRRKIKNNIKSGISFYIPELQIGVVSRLTANHISRVAAQYIMYKMGSYTKTITDEKTYFIKLIWLEMMTFFMSKVINPKRKTNTLSDIRQALNNASFEDKGKEALALSLEQKMKEIKYINSSNIKNTHSSTTKRKRFSTQSYMTASSILGGVLGEKTFHAYNKKIVRFPQSQNFLFKNLNQKTFEISYYEAIEIIDSWPSPFKSKFDQY